MYLFINHSYLAVSHVTAGVILKFVLLSNTTSVVLHHFLWRQNDVLSDSRYK